MKPKVENENFVCRCLMIVDVGAKMAALMGRQCMKDTQIEGRLGVGSKEIMKLQVDDMARKELRRKKNDCCRFAWKWALHRSV